MADRSTPPWKDKLGNLLHYIASFEEKERAASPEAGGERRRGRIKKAQTAIKERPSEEEMSARDVDKVTQLVIDGSSVAAWMGLDERRR